MNNINKYLIDVNYYKIKSDMIFELRSISKNILFLLNELLLLLDVKDDEFYDGGLLFIEDIILFINIMEVVINKVEF